MSKTIQEYIIHTRTGDWTPLVETGVDTTGISVMPLRVDRETGRAPTFLLRFQPGAKYPYHDEEIFVLEGNCVIEGAELNAGDYLYTPPGFKHSVRTETGCTMLFQVPEEVVILDPAGRTQAPRHEESR